MSRSGTRRHRLRRALDGFFFGFGGVAAAWLSYLVLRIGITSAWAFLLAIVFWVFTAYLVLPRLHRVLTSIYLPDYFIGRTRTADGLLGDPVNLAIRGSEEQVHQAMLAAGWTRAQDLSLASGWRIVTATLARRSYAEAPVSPLLLFGRQQDFAYQQEVAGSPSKRHHVRFWHTPDGWLLPGGFAVDWLAAGTYDRSVGLSLFTGQITHKIDRRVDVERDHIVTTVTAATPNARVEMIENFSSGYHQRNGGGDLIQTDGDLPVIELGTAAAPVRVTEPQLPSHRRPPVQVVFGSTTSLLWGLFNLLVAAVVATDAAAAELTQDQAVVVAIILAVAGLTDVALGVFVLLGSDLARIVALFFGAIAIVTAYWVNANGTAVISLTTNLITIAIGVLVLLALSGRPARLHTRAGFLGRHTERQALE